MIRLQSSVLTSDRTITLSGSKSETNRLLLLQALYPTITLVNTSNSDDSKVMRQALQNPQPATRNPQLIDVHHAGTAMRFLTAFFATQEGREVTLTGSARMKERPIKILVDVLQSLGADIQYLENEGFPPLLIKGKKLQQNTVAIEAGVSSQYLSALLLVAPSLPNGLSLELQGRLTSEPYLNMTLALLQELGVNTRREGSLITVSPLKTTPKITLAVESDWSSASYFYSLVALSPVGTCITLQTFKQKSLQGDRRLANIYEVFGVTTQFHENHAITLLKTRQPEQEPKQFDLIDCPDIAQTIAVTAFGLGLACHLTGLHTLKIKETDRLSALQYELTKFGANIVVTNKALMLHEGSPPSEEPKDVLQTYQDHRMAMAFAPLALRVPFTIENPEVVTKSYPDFWKDMKQVGIRIDC
jgi:3-phosphoshikimate 1-carboxyvinyltransferase